MIGLHPVYPAPQGSSNAPNRASIAKSKPDLHTPPRPSKGQAIQRPSREEIGLMSPVLPNKPPVQDWPLGTSQAPFVPHFGTILGYVVIARRAAALWAVV